MFSIFSLDSIKKNKELLFTLLEITSLVLILLLAVGNRFPNLETNPGWYTDEGTLVELANNILKGQDQYLAIKDSGLLFGRPPLFIHLLAFAFRFLPAGIGTLRIVTASLGLLTIAMLFMLTRTCLGRKGILLAALSAFMLAISPMAIKYSRIGYSYQLLAPLILFGMLAGWKYAYSRKLVWLFLGATALGIGTLSDLIMFMAFPAFLLVVIVSHWRHTLLALVFLFLPFTLYSFYFLITDAQTFLFDLRFLLTRSSGFPILYLIPAWIKNFSLLLNFDVWIFPGLVGLLLIRPVRFGQWVLLSWMLPVLLLSRYYIVSGLSYYYASPWVSLPVIGMAALLLFGTQKLYFLIKDGLMFLNDRFKKPARVRQSRNNKSVIKISSLLVTFFIVVAPLAYLYHESAESAKTHLITDLEYILVDPENARAAGDLVNGITDENDLVIASPVIAWLLDSRTADFQMVLAADGAGTVHLPANMDKDRFAYDTHLSTARFAILDPVWWYLAGTSVPQAKGLAEQIQSEWSLILQSGDISVYQNPDK